MTVLCAADLDRTLIFSRTAVGSSAEQLVPVERRAKADASWMTAHAAADFDELSTVALVVPVTTRTPRQCAGLMLPGPAPRYLVAANGGVLLVNGSPDRAWAAQLSAALGTVASLAEIRAQVDRICRPEWTHAVRDAAGLFCYAVVDRDQLPTDAVSEAADQAAMRGWRVSLQGRKLYWVPAPLRKSTAVHEIARREGTAALLAAGDSMLDADLLACADAGIASRDGELVRSGWTAPHISVTSATGVRAGAEIVRWLLDLARLSVPRDGAGRRTAAPAAGRPGAELHASRSPDPRAPAD